MPSASPTPEKPAEIEDLTRAIREAVDAEIGELAANLATTDDAHLFGQNEFGSCNQFGGSRASEQYPQELVGDRLEVVRPLENDDVLF